MAQKVNVKDKIEYMIVVLGEFARQHRMSYQAAYRYFYVHQGVDFLDKGYNVEHLFSIEDAVIDVTAYCKRFGGHLG